MSHMERCANCGVIHYPGKQNAVYIGGKYYCKPSCANAHREKEKGHADTLTDRFSGALTSQRRRE